MKGIAVTGIDIDTGTCTFDHPALNGYDVLGHGITCTFIPQFLGSHSPVSSLPTQRCH